MKKGYLILSNGTVFEGWKIGADTESVGEVVFTTGVVGYLETLTDPSYDGQIVTQTFPTIGIYGVIPEDFEGDCAVKGYIVRELCDTPSNFRSQGILDDFLKKQNVCGLCGIDTRQLTRILREQGVMNGKISVTPACDMEEIKNFRVNNVVAAVSSQKAVIYPANGENLYKIALIDYGAKHNILRCLQKRGCEVKEYPYDTTAEEILADQPDGVMLSNGPGDPSEDTFCIEQIRKLLGKVPLFGICLGHQLTALALGGQTVKLKYGHHGVNQPVRDVKGSRTFITSQNHGYAVVAESLKGKGSQIYVNANDGSNEGMEYPDYNAFTVQFHPEACGGPQDMEFLFDRFISMMEEKKNAEE
ncbi:MAG: glutamine-hydrolyzing carbamoyl-phosphate synthase small subunit [Clostridia bacterium]|nr:glutamine-hydrolyzing carbamoyl-phosphate synthase small subunit [Clostridia bacterium]